MPASMFRNTTLIGAAIIALSWLGSSGARDVANIGRAAPEFTQSDPKDWINSDPVTLESLRGRVVLVDFWTFECWNCYRSFPWLNSLEARYQDQGLRIVGVHSPEFAHEREHARVAQKVREFELHHPVMIDNDFSYWKALDNKYWPAFYLIDANGRIADVFVGETHLGDRRARRIEARIEELLEAALGG